MRTQISFALACALFVPVVFGQACISGGEIEQNKQDVEDTVTGQLPLSPACGDCAEQALATSCSDELEACVNTPNCLDVSGCMDQCQADDVGCFADCAAASAPFVALVDCVICDTCGQDCSNDWTCGDDPPPPPPPPTEECAECLLHQSAPECQQLAQECLDSEDCIAAAECVAGCGLTDDCVQQCVANVSDETAHVLSVLVECSQQEPCAQVCNPDGNPPNPPDDDCTTCAQNALEQQCGDVTQQCLATEGCTEILECASQCGGAPDCVAQCSANVSDEAMAVANEVIACAVCDACADVCDPQLCP